MIVAECEADSKAANNDRAKRCHELVTRYQGGDDSAREELILILRRWAYSIAGRFHVAGMSTEDWQSEAVLAMIEAIDDKSYRGPAVGSVASWIGWAVRRRMTDVLRKAKNSAAGESAGDLSDVTDEAEVVSVEVVAAQRDICRALRGVYRSLPAVERTVVREYARRGKLSPVKRRYAGLSCRHCNVIIDEVKEKSATAIRGVLSQHPDWVGSEVLTGEWTW